jgi:hypothetical protein
MRNWRISDPITSHNQDGSEVIESAEDGSHNRALDEHAHPSALQLDMHSLPSRASCCAVINSYRHQADLSD